MSRSPTGWTSMLGLSSETAWRCWAGSRGPGTCIAGQVPPEMCSEPGGRCSGIAAWVASRSRLRCWYRLMAGIGAGGRRLQGADRRRGRRAVRSRARSWRRGGRAARVGAGGDARLASRKADQLLHAAAGNRIQIELSMQAPDN